MEFSDKIGSARRVADNLVTFAGSDGIGVVGLAATGRAGFTAQSAGESSLLAFAFHK